MRHSHFMKFTLFILQALIDAMLYQLCFYFVLMFFKANGFTFEVRMFLMGAMNICFLFNSLYGFGNWTLWDETISVLKAGTLILLLSTFYLYAKNFSLSFFVVMMSIAIFVPVTLAGRCCLRYMLFFLGQYNSVLILGAGDAGKIFAHNLTSSSFAMRRVEGFLDDDDEKQGKTFEGIPVLGKLRDFRKVQNHIHADEAVIAIPTASRKTIAYILNYIEDYVERVLYIPDMYMLTTYTASIRNIDGMPIMSSSQGLLNPVNVLIKTVIDYIGAVIALIVFSPIMLWAAYMIRKEDGEPALFIQDRVGWKAKHFMTYKFRTMYTDADERTKILFSNPEILEGYKEGIKLKEDPRVTKIGAFLRKTSIDELPQLINVLKGEMSLVGPRPLPQFDVDLLYSDEHILHKVYAAKPGLTGIWQVSGRSDLDAEFRRKINCYYVHNWSIWLDIAILLKTPLAVISSKGAY